jgi:hypothetical protein
MQDAVGDISIRAVSAEGQFPWILLVIAGIVTAGGYYLLKK